MAPVSCMSFVDNFWQVSLNQVTDYLHDHVARNGQYLLPRAERCLRPKTWLFLWAPRRDAASDNGKSAFRRKDEAHEARMLGRLPRKARVLAESAGHNFALGEVFSVAIFSAATQEASTFRRRSAAPLLPCVTNRPSSRTPRVAFGWCAPLPSRCTRTGSKPCAISTWITWHTCSYGPAILLNLTHVTAAATSFLLPNRSRSRMRLLYVASSPRRACREKDRMRGPWVRTYGGWHKDNSLKDASPNSMVGAESNRLGRQSVHDEPTHSLGEISKECISIRERICRLRWRVIHEREMTGPFDDVHLYRRWSLYDVIQELHLSGRRDLILCSRPGEDRQAHAVQRARRPKEISRRSEKHQPVKSPVRSDGNTLPRARPRLSTDQREQHRCSNRMPHTRHRKPWTHDIIESEPQPARTKQQIALSWNR